MIELEAENEAVPYQVRPPGPLVTIGSIRKELAAVYREGRMGKLDLSKATRLTFILQTLARLIQADEIEQRLAALEKTISTSGRVFVYEEFSEADGGN